MKKHKKIFVMIYSIILAFGLLSCKSEILSSNAQSKKEEPFIIDENGTYYYSLDYLRAYMGEQENDKIDRDLPYARNTIDKEQLMKQLPGIVLCSDEYAYYNIECGGRYFVFWIKGYSLDEPTKEIVCVRHSAYIPSVIDSDKGLHLQGLSMGQSSLQDAKRVDPDLELNYCLSSCDLVTYSLIDFETIVEIRYTYNTANNRYIVDSVESCPRSASASIFSHIRNSDFPRN